MKTSIRIRAEFLKYFADRGHRVVASHSLIPPADPTLLFVNAGMVQFKDAFTGLRDPGYRRATTTQKCLRVSGKHNDLEQVGRTPRHHTFFEMLGNFSFGDYFKESAIPFGWELLTRVYGIDPAELWVTIHPEDEQARAIWLDKVGVDPGRVVTDPSNFWAMGDTGPCGPCSEIHIDRGPTYRGTSMQDPGDRFMELWNLVFMQYDRDSSGRLTPLPAPSIDTGMGLERVCAVLQGVRSNYETDLFMPLIERAAEVAGARYGRDEDTDVALRVIADHARATAFLVSDGIYPENEGRGYVLRRLMRRALRFGHKLGLRGPFFTSICLEVGGVMGAAWPELEGARSVIERVAGQEEDRFLRTLSSGMDLLDRAIAATRAAGGKTLDGDTVFTLYDTNGFPADLTEVIAEEHGLGIDHDGPVARMERQRERGRASWKAAGTQGADLVAACLERGHGSEFLGYETTVAEATVLLVAPDGEAAAGGEADVVTDRTPFYGESGGQVGDTGRVEWQGGRGDVLDARRPHPDVIAHRVRVTEGVLKAGDRVRLVVDAARRDLTRKNHSATHLLHRALREVLGQHVRQRGSLVAPERLRFDYSHTGPMTEEEIVAVEDRVTAWVLEDAPITTDVLPFDEAVARGALHFFGDKYGDVVRMVAMGGSRELCGGTHVSRTGEIGLVKVVSEAGVSAGVRRLEALTGPGVLAYLRERDRVVSSLSRLLRTDPATLPERVERMIADERALRKDLADARVQAAASGAGWKAGGGSGGGSGGGAPGNVREAGGIKVSVVSADEIDPKAMRELADVMRDKVGSGLVLLTRSDGARLAVVLAATKDVAERRPANLLLQAALGPLGGRGGGNPLLAQGGIPDAAGAPKVLDALLATLQS
ncbi:MAG: alanine--tRNA ligase [Deltaproteobacteria bacterium]|nr:alanine--tRNA ligase [Deltaproteobacteria bacterium]